MADQGFRFPERVQGPDGAYRLVYDPANPNTILPNLSDPQTVRVSCSPVRVQGRNGLQELYMARVEIHLAGRTRNGRLVGAQHLRGFRLYTSDELRLRGLAAQEAAERTPPQEMAIYLEENAAQTEDISQGFLDAIMGVSLAEMPRPNATWAADVLGPAVAPQGPQPEEAE